MAKPVSTVSIPRFLLPQLTWRAPNLKPAAALPSAASARRQRPREGGSREGHQADRVPQLKHHPFPPQKRQHDLEQTSVAHAMKHQQQDGRTALNQSIFRALQASVQPAGSAPARPRFQHARSPSGSLLMRSFHTSQPMRRDHHFDTLKFVQRLKDEGFTEEQATAMMRVLSDVIEESIQNLTRTMVLREDAERAAYTQKVDFTKLRSELLSSDNAEASLTRASHERLSNDLAKIGSRLRDEVGRTQASVRLDLNLEKGRIREEANVQELKIKETEARIEQEVAGLRERVEGVKFSTLQWLMGVCTGTAAIILGAWRLLM